MNAPLNTALNKIGGAPVQEGMQEFLTQNLKGIHMPSEIGFWPVAPVWWFITALVLFFLYVLIARFRRHFLANRYRKSASEALDIAYQQWLTNKDATQYIQTSNALLRRCVLHIQGNKSLAAFSGKAWAEVLDRVAPNTLSDATEFALTVQCYQASPDIDVDSVHREIKQWIKNHKAANLNDSVNAIGSEATHV